MKRFLAVLCLALALPVAVSARPVRVLPAPSQVGFVQRITSFLSLLWTHLRILPADGTVIIPPPH